MDLKSGCKLAVNQRWRFLSSIVMLLVILVTQNAQVGGWSTDSKVDKWEATETDENTFPTSDNVWWNQMPKKQSRSPRPNGGRPKYDPGLKWIGLGKRPDTHRSSIPVAVAPQVLMDMRNFFDGVMRHMRRMEQSRNARVAGSPEEVGEQAAGNQRALRFVTRSKNVKAPYDPALLWTGLGR